MAHAKLEFASPPPKTGSPLCREDSQIETVEALLVTASETVQRQHAERILETKGVKNASGCFLY